MTVANLLSLVSTLAIVAPGVFADMQVRQFNRQRARDSALQLLHSFQTPDFVNAVNIVFDLPEGLSKSEIESRLGTKIASVLVMFGTVESLGILVFRHEIDIKLVEDFCGGVIILATPTTSSVAIRAVSETRSASARGPRVHRLSRLEGLELRRRPDIPDERRVA